MDDPTDTAPAEQGADFSDLMGQADALEVAPAQAREKAEQQAGEKAAADAAAELLGALQMARMMVAPMFAWWPEFGETWGDQTLQGIAQSGGEIMRRHGWTMGDVLGQYGPYIALAGSTLPPAWVTWQAIKVQKERAKHERPEQAAS